MKYKAAYLIRANEDIYAAIRAALPPECDLIAPAATIGDADFAISGKVTAAMIDSAPNLKLILTPGIGTDGVDLAAAARRNVAVACTVCGNVTEVAEHTLMLMLAVSRRLTELDAALRQGRWLMWDRRIQSRNLAGRTLGLIGFGRIGQEVAARAGAFGMDVVYHDPVRNESWPYAGLDDLLAASDYVSLHVPLTPATRGILNAERIARMKPGAVLINTARGEVVDECALIDALESGHLSGAGLDVFAQEPPAPGNPLLSMPNVVMTPHSGAGTLDGLRVKAAQYAENIRRFLAGEPLIDSVQDARAEAAVR